MQPCAARLRMAAGLTPKILQNRLLVMVQNWNRRSRRVALGLSLLILWGVDARSWAQTPPSPPLPLITNLQQLTQTLVSERRVVAKIRLEVTVCAASNPGAGVIIAQDESGVELLQVGNFGRDVVPGERISIRGRYCLLRKREMGVEISAGPLVDNDGLHGPRTWPGAIALTPGKYPLRLEWFNFLHEFSLEGNCVVSNQPVLLSGSNFCHEVVDESSGQTNLLPGLVAECYEGCWESVPDFDLLQPVKVGVVTHFDLGFRTRDEMVGIRFTGYFNAPYDGLYRFSVRSDDGSLLFVRKAGLPLVTLGFTNVPPPGPAMYGERFSAPTDRRWMTLEGHVSFVSRMGKGLEFELGSGPDVVTVRLADAVGLAPAALLNSRVKVTGVGRAVLTSDERLVLGELSAAGAKDLVIVEKAFAPGEISLPLASAAQVQGLRIEDARRGLPVRLRGIVTAARNASSERWLSLQDETRGIFVQLSAVSNAFPAFRERWEVVGRSGAGDFAPVVIAEKMTLLGDGRLPEPVRPTWSELVNGSRDVQWAEIQGLVTDVASNIVTLLLPEGRLDVQMDGYGESELTRFKKAIVRIRGVLHAVWNADTREVRVGSVVMRNATISVDVAAPADPFDAVLKTPRELLLFDTRATAFRRVKVRGQIVYADPNQAFLEENGTGLRLLPAERTTVRPGDLVEAVGYPDIGRSALLLREVILRKTGGEALPPGKTLAETDLTHEGLDSTRVRVEGQLLGWHAERGSLVLEMQSGSHLYLARLALGAARTLSLRSGSHLRLEGVFLEGGRNQNARTEAKSFEVMLNSLSDIVVRSQPSWWTLERLLIVVGVLLVILMFTAIWITQLRRLVEQRTSQLQREIREREQVERKHALEAERSRIARDLHDDLGSSLTEIGVLAAKGQRLQSLDTVATLFRGIADKARGLVSALDVIVWTINPEDNSLQSAADYLCDFTSEYLSQSEIVCRFDVPVTLPSITLEGRLRHHLLLAVKETLNNIVRHAKATEVEFRLAFADDQLEIVISDNGKGFDTTTRGSGKGLKNLSLRLTKLGGRYEVESAVGKGTTVKIRLRLSPPAEGAMSDRDRDV
jgi:signal transduction histidine kinase